MSRVFRWIWRVNAVLISIGGLLAIGALLLVSYFVAKEATDSDRAYDLVNVQEQAEIQEELTFGYSVKIDGTDIAVIQLNSNQTYRSGISGSNEAFSTRNLLFVNLGTSTGSWLLPDIKSLITRHSFLPEPKDCCGAASRPVVAVYEIVAADTNGDGRLSADDKLTFAMSALDGGGFKEVLTNIDSVVTTLFHEPDQLVVVYYNGSKTHLATIGLTDFMVQRDRILAPPGKID